MVSTKAECEAASLPSRSEAVERLQAGVQTLLVTGIFGDSEEVPIAREREVMLSEQVGTIETVIQTDVLEADRGIS